jgi:hypothetical protein
MRTGVVPASRRPTETEITMKKKSNSEREAAPESAKHSRMGKA